MNLLSPENWKLRLQLLKQLSAQGQPEEALTEARELAKPSDAPPEALLAMGNLLWEESSSRAEALKVWQRLAPPDSQDPAKIALLAELLSSKGETDAAIVESQRLVAVNPSAADARQKLAQLFLKKDDRKSVWVFKNSRNDLALDIANYRLYSGSYEVGTHVDSLFISQIDQGIYKIELNLKYYQTEFEHKSNFLVKLQE